MSLFFYLFGWLFFFHQGGVLFRHGFTIDSVVELFYSFLELLTKDVSWSAHFVSLHATLYSRCHWQKVRCFESNQIKPFELTRKNQTAGGYMPSSILIHRIDKSVQFRPFRYLKRVTKSMGDSIDRNKANTILFFKKLWFAIPRLSTWFKLVSIT